MTNRPTVGFNGSVGFGFPVCIHWSVFGCSNSVKQETNADYDEQHAESRCPGEHGWALDHADMRVKDIAALVAGCDFNSPNSSGVAPEARRTSGQVLCYRGLAFVRLKTRERSAASGGIPGGRVRKSLRKIGARKVSSSLSSSRVRAVLILIPLFRTAC